MIHHRDIPPSVILHIGTPKAASTTFQTAMAMHAQQLRANGISPYLPMPNHWLATVVAPDYVTVGRENFGRPVAHWGRLRGLDTCELESSMRSLKDFLRRYSGESVVLSTELLALVPVETAGLQRLVNVFLETHSQVRVVSVLRHPLEQSISYTTELVKAGYTTQMMDAEKAQKTFLNAAWFLGRWEGIPDVSHTVVSVSTMYPSVVSLSEFLGVDVPVNFSNESRANQRISWRAVRILNAVNEMLGAKIGFEPTNSRPSGLPRLLSAALPDQERPLWSKNDVEEFALLARSSLEWINRRSLATDPLAAHLTHSYKDFVSPEPWRLDDLDAKSQAVAVLCVELSKSAHNYVSKKELVYRIRRIMD